jgi:hypothetical protein
LRTFAHHTRFSGDDLEFGIAALLAMFASHCAAFSEKRVGWVVPKMIPILGFNCHSLLGVLLTTLPGLDVAKP